MKKIIFGGLFLFMLFFSSTQIALADYTCLCTNTGAKTIVSDCAGCTCTPNTCVSADPNSQKTVTTLPNPLGTTNINTFAARIISYILGLVGTISLLLFVYGGITWMTSAGSSDKVKKGRDILVWAVIGMAVVFMAYIMVKFVIQGVQGVF